MDVVIKSNAIEVFLSSLASHTLVLREHQVIGLAGVLGIILLDEIILRVALGTDKRAHLLMGGLANILTGSCPCLVEGRTGRTQIHRASIVTVGTSHGIDNLTAQVAPFASIIICGIED